MPSPILLAILQNQIKNAVDENKVDTSKFPIYKTIGDASELTEEEKNDISKNVYQFLIDRYSNLYVLDSSSETSQYKIVLATYDVNAAKVTFVEKVLP